MASVVSQLIEEVTAPAQRDSLKDAREICADGTYFLNNLRMNGKHNIYPVCHHFQYPLISDPNHRYLIPIQAPAVTSLNRLSFITAATQL